MTHPNHEIVREFFAALTNGDVPDALLTPDMTAWTTAGGDADRAQFQMGIKLLASIFKGHFVYTVNALTAEEDRVAAEVEGNGTLITGEPYYNRYVFMFRIRDGKVAWVGEHADTVPIRTHLVPLLAKAMAGAQDIAR